MYEKTRGEIQVKSNIVAFDSKHDWSNSAKQLIDTMPTLGREDRCTS